MHYDEDLADQITRRPGEFITIVSLIFIEETLMYK